MLATRTLLIIGVFCITSILCRQCDFEDSQCLTKAERRVFIQLVAGIPGVEPSDPLHQDFIETSLDSLRYRVMDGYLSGMMKCKVELLKIFDNVEYDYHISCPKLTLMSKYEMMAVEPTLSIKSKGNCNIELYDFRFLIHGVFQLTAGNMGKKYMKLITHDLSLKPGNVTYRYRDLSDDGRDNSQSFKDFANYKWKSVVNRTLNPVLEAFMKKHIQNKNAFLAIVPIQDLYYHEKTDEKNNTFKHLFINKIM